MYKKYSPVVAFFSFLLLGASIYSVGLNGSFLFDDFPNLQDLGTYGTIDSWDKARNFINNGFSGPTGRPISLASFLLNDNTWPSLAYSFKYTNLMIHLLNGILLCWATLLLLRNYKYQEQQAVWIAIVTMAIWLLHPYFISTTLYVIQRMAQLAALFSLIGIVGYLKYRLMLATKPITAYIGMTVSIGLCTILATYSKENGALLPLLLLIIEFCNPNKEAKPCWPWRVVCLWLPSLAIGLMMYRYVDFSANPWPNRNFNQVERLFSELRIVTEYLFNLLLPQIELRGLYQDGYLISKSLTQPITTLYSAIFLIFLFTAAFLCRKKYPLLALAILFFFASHLMESTVIGLELYFEHRNYLAALFLFLPISSGLYLLKTKIDPKLVYLILGVLLIVLSIFSYERAKLWSDTEQLKFYWAKNTPNSARAQNEIATMLLEKGQILQANAFLEQAKKRLPDSALLNMQLLLQKVQFGLATEQDFKTTAESLAKQPFDAQAMQALRVLTEFVIERNKQKQYGMSALSLIEALENNAVYKNISVFQRLSVYLKAKLNLAMNDIPQALIYYEEALKRYNDTEAGLMMVAELGSHGAILEALQLLDQVELVYKKQDTQKLHRSRAEYNMEIKRLRSVLQQDLAQGESHVAN